MKKMAFALTIMMGLSSFMACNVTAQDKNDKKDTKVETKASPVGTLTEKEFNEQIFNVKEGENATFRGKGPVVIDFYATWCGPCKKMAPVLEELATEYAGKVSVYKIDIDKERSLATSLGIRSIPTFLVVDGKGNPEWSVGMMSKEEFKAKFEKITK